MAGVAAARLYRWTSDSSTWRPISEGLPPGSTILAFATDPRDEQLFWASRDGGGIYRSTDLGDHWQNAGRPSGATTWYRQSLQITRKVEAPCSGQQPQEPGPCEVQEKKVRRRKASMRGLSWSGHMPAPPTRTSQLANIGLRLFLPNSLEQPACSWSPDIVVLQSVNTDPLMPLDRLATQRTVDGNPFPFWELNDVEVGTSTDASDKYYFMIRVDGVETRTSIWAHGSDPRTYFPVQDVPSGLAMGNLEAIDARIEIVWPHDEAGAGLPATEGTFVNVGVSLFKHGTRLSVPVGWQPEGITLFGAWNQEIGRALSTDSRVERRQSGAIAYPQWQFDNIPVDRALDPSNKLFLWVEVDGVETHTTIWTHGADARTVFPVKDEPILGCLP